jgi:hypothetical protein
MNWLISLFCAGEVTKQLQVGSRVNTPKGWGTVTSGCIHVDLDTKPHKVRRFNQGFNIDTIKVTS